MKLKKILFIALVVGGGGYSCSTPNNDVTYREEEIPRGFYGIVVNSDDSIIRADQDLDLKATLTNDYLFKLAQTNGKKNYLTAEYFIYDPTQPQNIGSNHVYKGVIENDTAIIKLDVLKNEPKLKANTNLFCEIRLGVDFSSRYPGPDTIFIVLHSFMIEEL